MFNRSKYISLCVLLSAKVFASEMQVEINGTETVMTHSIVSAQPLADHYQPDPAEKRDYATLDTQFERVIGLGRNCLTKAEINAYFNPTSHFFQTKSQKADLFDWMVIGNYDLFARALTNKLQDIFNKEDFIIKGNSEYGFVNSKYDLRWVHLLGKYLSNSSKEERENGSYLLEIFHKHFDEEKAKINYLRDKFVQSKDQKTLYIISHYDLSTESLLKVRDGDKDFMLLYVSEKKESLNLGNILIRSARNVNSSWKVEPNSIYWKEVFDEFKFTDNIWS